MINKYFHPSLNRKLVHLVPAMQGLYPHAIKGTVHVL